MSTHIDLMDGVTLVRASQAGNHSSLKIRSASSEVTIYLEADQYAAAKRAEDVLSVLIRPAVATMPVHLGHLLDRVPA